MFKLCVIGDLGFEFWKDIPDYEGFYQASTYGRVRSVGRFVRGKSGSKIFLNSTIRIQFVGLGGYYFIGLHKRGRTNSYSTHRIVAKTFLPNPLNFPCINHKDENKFNNHVENLEWCTIAYNNNYGTRTQRMANKERNSPIRSRKVLQYDLNGNLISKYPSANEVERKNGFSQGNISACCRGKQKTAYGYIWQYE